MQRLWQLRYKNGWQCEIVNMEEKDILVIDDDCDLAEITSDFLSDHGYEVMHTSNIDTAEKMTRQYRFKLLLLDINLPDGTGFSLCEKLRQRTNLPIIMISARTSDTDKTHGLDIGADDYIEKPYSLSELLSRVKALLRRSYNMLINEDLFSFGKIVIDIGLRKVIKKGVPVSLSVKEFDLLRFLIENKNKTVSKEDIFATVWGTYHDAELSTVTVHIRWLREKLEDDSSRPQYLKTVWGVGYCLEIAVK